MKKQEIKSLILTMLLMATHSTLAVASVYTLNQSSGTVSVLNAAYIDNMTETWNINTGSSNKPVKLTYDIDTEFCSDYLGIYSVDNSGNATLIVSLSGAESGTVLTNIPNGKVKVVFTSDYNGSYYNGNTGFTGFSLQFSADSSYTTSGNDYVAGSSVIMGNLGIGVTNPLAKLHLNGSIRGNAAGGALKVQTSYGYIELGPQFSDFSTINTDRPKFLLNKPVYLSSGQISSFFGTDLALQTSGTTRMTISSSTGKVGIGTTTPNQALSVKGGVSISPTSITSSELYNGSLMITKPAASGQYINLVRAANAYWSIGTVYNSNTFAIGSSTTSDASFTSPYFAIMTGGNVGIGTKLPKYKLDVKGTIRATEVLIQSVDSFPDFVFEQDYKLPTLSNVQQFIQTNGHLPNIPSATEVKEKGMSLVDMQKKLLQKIEELTLYIIEQQKEIDGLKQAFRNR